MELGRVAGAHGIRGELRVLWFGDGPEHLQAARFVELARDRDDPAPRRVEVLEARPGRPGELRLRIEGTSDRDGAESLRGLRVLAPADTLPPLPEGEHYWYELVGCRVASTQGREVGTVRELIETGAHDVLVVETPEGRTCLVPTAAELLVEIDVEGRRILVEERPGLLEPVDPPVGVETSPRRRRPRSGSTSSRSSRSSSGPSSRRR